MEIVVLWISTSARASQCQALRLELWTMFHREPSRPPYLHDIDHLIDQSPFSTVESEECSVAAIPA